MRSVRDRNILSMVYRPLTMLSVVLCAVLNLAASCEKTSETAAPQTQEVNLSEYIPTQKEVTTAGVDRGPEAGAETQKPVIQVKFLELKALQDEVLVGSTVRLRVLGITEDHQKIDLTDESDFSVSDSEILKMHESQSGVVVGRSGGAAQITARYGELSATVTVGVVDVGIEKIDITPKTVVVGADVQFFATALMSDGSSVDITNDVKWESANHLIVGPVDVAKGKFRGERSGITNVGVEYQGRKANSKVEVKLQQIIELAVTSDINSILFGTSVQMKAIATYANGTKGDVTGSVQWTSESPAVASVSDAIESKGLVQTLTAGQVTVRASVGQISGSFPLTVTSISFYDYRFDQQSVKVPKGKKHRIKFLGVYLNGATQDISQEAIWSSDKPYLALISNVEGFEGEVEALDVGDVAITVVYGTTIRQINVQVTEAAVVEMTLKTTSPNVVCGVNNPIISAEGLLSDGTTMDVSNLVTFSVDNGQYASISNDPASRGKVFTLKSGSVKILASLYEPIIGVTVAAELPLSIQAPVLEGFKINAAYESIAVGASMQIYAVGEYSCEVLPPVDFTTQGNWTISDNPFIAINNTTQKGFVTSSGDVVSETATVVTFTKDTFTATYQLKVRPKEVMSLQLKTIPQADFVDVGSQKQIYARAIFSDNTYIDITDVSAYPGYSLSWASSLTANLTVDETTSPGTVTGILEKRGVRVSATIVTPQSKTFSANLFVDVRSPCSTGVRDGVYCYFESDVGQSCTEKCAAISGVYTPADVYETGSEATVSSCANVLTKLGYASGLSKDNQVGPDGVGAGCAVLSYNGLLATRRYTSPSTAAGEKHPNLRRVCSCRNP